MQRSVVLPIAVLLLSLNTLHSSASVLFGAKSDFAVAGNPRVAAIGDLNGDGKFDLVSTNGSGNALSVLIGNGDGTFGSRTDFPTGPAPNSVALGDFNADGKLDAAVVNYSGNTISVLLGNGSGGFAPKTDYGTGNTPYSLAIGDLNGDNTLDIAVVNFYSGTVSVFPGNGSGGFGAKSDYGTAWNPMSVAIGDFNADGKADLAVSSYASSCVSVLLGTGGGAFASATNYSTGSVAWSVATGDLNADGKLDLAVANQGSNTVSILRGNGNGTFLAKVDYSTGGAPNSVSISDLNSDGRPDLAIAVQFGASVLLGAGGGAFATKTDYVTNGAFAPSLAVRDLNADNEPDLVVVNYVENTVSVLLHQPLPVLVGVRDVRNDQGGQVKVLWNASARDLVAPLDVESYWVLRSVPSSIASEAARGGVRVSRDPSDVVEPQVGAIQAVTLNGAAYYWEYVASQPAFHMPTYSYVATTTCDSIAGSNPRTAFMIMARTTGGASWWFSEPDSGYSVDNLAPAAPGPVAGQYASGASSLHWAASTAEDFAAYRIYRGTAPGFVPAPSNRIATQPDTSYTDTAGAPSYYRVSVLDVHGNEGSSTLVLPTGTTEVETAVASFSLAGAKPNPSRCDHLTIAFTLPASSSARLELLDVSGRRVASREVGELGAGPHVVELSAGRPLAPGLYLARLTQGAATLSTRIAIVR